MPDANRQPKSHLYDDEEIEIEIEIDFRLITECLYVPTPNALSRVGSTFGQ